MAYLFITLVGAFVIRPQRGDPKRSELWIKGERYGSYLNAQFAASDVGQHTTGFKAWDMAANLQAPMNLVDWQNIREF